MFKGFTFIEMMIVVAIIAVLAVMVTPRLFSQLDQSKMRAAKLQVKLLSSALDIYHLDTGRYPSSEEGLKALIMKPDGAAGWFGPYIKEISIPKDPWGQDYIYKYPGVVGVDYDLFSFGADGKEGGSDIAEDIGNW